MPHVMVPRFLKMVEAMRLTPTSKMQVLHDGNGPSTWDRKVESREVR
jgi:hypothetical protein